MRSNLFLGATLMVALASSTSFGDITLTFDSDTQGWHKVGKLALATVP